ncbi:Alpha-17 giardin [Giardia muris]|uniref:Alpha-17 giardin n=1 Tax=Giardia muris TaxID=5742 RepID=A0A142C645_GIAMU|nr:alpha-17 giardin [Giardia muris]TNJ29460.1 Alpha-17 giardin [Giardia muris]|eukprot:TNJ29460.1 Alpha-17 giardin [Giardia muris]
MAYDGPVATLAQLVEAGSVEPLVAFSKQYSYLQRVEIRRAYQAARGIDLLTDLQQRYRKVSVFVDVMMYAWSDRSKIVMNTLQGGAKKKPRSLLFETAVVLLAPPQEWIALARYWEKHKRTDIDPGSGSEPDSKKSKNTLSHSQEGMKSPKLPGTRSPGDYMYSPSQASSWGEGWSTGSRSGSIEAFRTDSTKASISTFSETMSKLFPDVDIIRPLLRDWHLVERRPCEMRIAADILVAAMKRGLPSAGDDLLSLLTTTRPPEWNTILQIAEKISGQRLDSLKLSTNEEVNEIVLSASATLSSTSLGFSRILAWALRKKSLPDVCLLTGFFFDRIFHLQENYSAYGSLDKELVKTFGQKTGAILLGFWTDIQA